MDDNYEVFDHKSGVFLVIKNDQPLVDPNGQALLFYRKEDAETFIYRDKALLLASYLQCMRTLEERYDNVVLTSNTIISYNEKEIVKRKWFRKKR